MVKAEGRFTQEEKDRKTKEFLDTLPKESLTLDEKNLRDAIQNFLKKWPEQHGRQVLATTNDLGKCSVVQDAKLRTLPVYVSLKLWCEARLPMEIDFYRDVTKVAAPIAIGKRGFLDHEAAQRMIEEITKQPVEGALAVRCPCLLYTSPSPRD